MQSSKSEFSFLALGDSYTIGHGVPSKSSWPYQFSKKINVHGIYINTIDVIAKTGWRTDNLLTALNEETPSKKYNLISLMIGVNNQFQGKSLELFREDLRSLIQFSRKLLKTENSTLFVLSIPDYGATPFGRIERETIKKEIDEWNETIQTICKEESLLFVDITAISRLALQDEKLTSKDNLHPSAKMYALWVDEIIVQLQSFIKSSKR